MAQKRYPGEDYFLVNFRVLANVLFALCMFSSVMKVEFPSQDMDSEQLIAYITASFEALANFVVSFVFLALYWIKFVGKQQHIVRSNIVAGGARIDGRDSKTVRPIDSEIGLLSKTPSARCLNSRTQSGSPLTSQM